MATQHTAPKNEHAHAGQHDANADLEPRDHLGQGKNPAIELEKKNMEEAAKRGEAKAKEENKQP